MGAWGRLILRRASTRDFYRRTGRFNRGIFFARLLIPAWFALGLVGLGWRALIGLSLGLDRLGFDLPGLLLGTAPCYLAWMGLWWSQYPTERAVREQSILSAFDRDLPIHEPPGFGGYFASHFRLQILFTLVPIVLVLGVVDALDVALRPVARSVGAETAGHLHQALVLLAVAGIYILSPEILRRVLPTRPLEDSPLRQRLLRLASRQKLKVRNILLWQTHHNICNAAVMGIVGRFRYVLLTDLLIETMSDEQIEAVFAHEVGHIVHRHMQWYVLVIAILVLSISGFDQLLMRLWPDVSRARWLGLAADLWLTLATAAGFILAFGFLSRRFERQADVFAARTIERERSAAAEPPAGQAADALAAASAAGGHPVGPHGARVFASALHRVASINNIPLTSRRWTGGGAAEFFSFILDRAIEWINHYLHGSIARRTSYLHRLAQTPQQTRRFDAFMRRLYAALLLLFAASLAFAFHPRLLALW
jgi:STE24 endopeptidase